MDKPLPSPTAPVLWAVQRGLGAIPNQTNLRRNPETDEPHITAGQRRVVEVLLSSHHATTYEGVAARLGIGLGTVHTHLRRLRDRSPEL